MNKTIRTLLIRAHNMLRDGNTTDSNKQSLITDLGEAIRASEGDTHNGRIFVMYYSGDIGHGRHFGPFASTKECVEAAKRFMNADIPGLEGGHKPVLARRYAVGTNTIDVSHIEFSIMERVDF